MENNFNFTPGPWEIKGPSKRGDFAIIKDDLILSEAFKEVGKNVFLDSEANAKLVSCAPEMLNSLIIMLKRIYSLHNTSSKLRSFKIDITKEFLEHYKKEIDIVEKATGKKWEDIND